MLAHHLLPQRCDFLEFGFVILEKRAGREATKVIEGHEDDVVGKIFWQIASQTIDPGLLDWRAASLRYIENILTDIRLIRGGDENVDDLEEMLPQEKLLGILHQCIEKVVKIQLASASLEAGLDQLAEQKLIG